jgi:hypothetical protein
MHSEWPSSLCEDFEDLLIWNPDTPTLNPKSLAELPSIADIFDDSPPEHPRQSPNTTEEQNSKPPMKAQLNKKISKMAKRTKVDGKLS